MCRLNVSRKYTCFWAPDYLLRFNSYWLLSSKMFLPNRSYYLVRWFGLSSSTLQRFACPVEEKGFGQIDSGSRHIEHIAGIRNPRRHIFSKSRHRYYQNANSTFQCQRLLKCGDINPNPGPTKYPCACCERPCKNNQRALQYDGCNSWCHAKCTRVSQDEYNRLSSTDDTWYCNACTFKWLSDSL